MSKIEDGKYYVDGEGFYKCVGKKETSINKYVEMDEVMIRCNSLFFLKGITLLEEACERRMVECSEEDYNYVLSQAVFTYEKLADFKTKVFSHLWHNEDK